MDHAPALPVFNPKKFSIQSPVETSPLRDINNNDQLSFKDRLYQLSKYVHPVINLVTWGTAGASIAALEIKKYAYGPVNCDPSGLGSNDLHIGLIATCVTLSVINIATACGATTYISAKIKESLDALEDAKSKAAISFQDEAVVTDESEEDEAVVVDESKNIPNDVNEPSKESSSNLLPDSLGTTAIINGATSLAGALIGASIETLRAPAYMNGCYTGALKVGSIVMGVATTASLAVGAGAAYCVYKSVSNANELANKQQEVEAARKAAEQPRII